LLDSSKEQEYHFSSYEYGFFQLNVFFFAKSKLAGCGAWLTITVPPSWLISHLEYLFEISAIKNSNYLEVSTIFGGILYADKSQVERYRNKHNGCRNRGDFRDIAVASYQLKH